MFRGVRGALRQDPGIPDRETPRWRFFHLIVMLCRPFTRWRKNKHPMLDYHRQVSGRAVKGTLIFFGWEGTEPDWFNICLSIMGIVALTALGFVALAMDRWIVGVATITVSVLAMPAVYLWNFFVAAYLLDQELRAELQALRKPAWRFDEAVAQRLQELLNEGNALIDSRSIVEKRLPQNVWVEDLVSWCTRTQELLSSHLARSEAIGFSSISVFPSIGLPPPQLQNILRVRHNKLRLIAMRYMEAAPAFEASVPAPRRAER